MLHKKLKHLKKSGTNVDDIRRVSKQLRHEMAGNASHERQREVKQNSREYFKNPWDFMSSEKEPTNSPTFYINTCFQYFKNNPQE